MCLSKDEMKKQTMEERTTFKKKRFWRKKKALRKGHNLASLVNKMSFKSGKSKFPLIFQVTIEAFVRTGLNNSQVCTSIDVKILSS